MEITAPSLQTVNTNQNILFTNTAVAGNCSIIHRSGSGLVSLRGITNQCRARFKVGFNANVAIPTNTTVAPIVLSISVDGENLPEGTMISSPTLSDNFNNISSCIFIDIPCKCCAKLSIKNISTIEVNVENANLMIERVA